MKKIYLSLLMLLSLTQARAQANLLVEAPLNDNANSTLIAPNGLSAHAFYSGCYLVLQDELKNIPSGTSITSFGFTLAVGVSGTQAQGNFTVWLQNTTNATYQKGTSFSNAITGMTQVYANVMTIPVSAVTTSVVVTLSTPFTYNGNGLYVAYDYAATAYGTTNAAYFRETSRLPLPGGGGAYVSSPTSAQNTLGLTNLRPAFLFGFTNNNSNDAEVFAVFAAGKIPAMLNGTYSVTAVVKNLSNTSLSNITVSLNISGANVFAGTQTVSSLAPGALATVQFAGFNPQNVGTNLITISVGSDQNNLNNSMTYTQQVTCNIWSSNPPAPSFSINGVGWSVASVPPTSGAGIISTGYFNPASSTLSAIRVAISSPTLSIGNNVYGVLQDNLGTILATTNTVSITSGMLGGFITFTFSNPPVLAANTTYYLGMAAMAGSVIFRPYGTIGAYYLPNFYTYSGIGGGALTVLTSNFGYFGFEGILLPNIQLSAAPVVVSCGSPATLQAVSSTNYSWSTGATTSSIVVSSPTSTSQYTVTATNTLGCSVSTVAVVNVTPFPLTISASANTICLGSAVTLTISGGSTYTWSTNSNLATITESPTSTTLYTVVSKNLQGCTNNAAIAVSVQSFSNLTVAPTTTTVCKGGQVNFVAGSAASYTWDTGTSTINTASINSTPVSSGQYTITGANPLGCLMSKTVNITVNSTTIIATPDTTICRGTTITLSATGGSNYVWNSTFSFATVPVSPSVATVYNVTGIGPTGCPGSTSLIVTVNENPTVTASATRTLMCKNEKNTITALGAATYSWNNGAATPSIVITATNTTPQHFTVTGYNAEGCQASAKVSITVSNCNGLQEQFPGGYRVYPNPTSGAFFLELGESGETHIIEVYTALGQLIQRESSDQSMYQFNLREQSNGIYIIKVSRNNSVIGTTRLVKN